MLFSEENLRSPSNSRWRFQAGCQARRSVVFALHNFAYRGAELFRPVDAVLVPSRCCGQRIRAPAWAALRSSCVKDPFKLESFLPPRARGGWRRRQSSSRKSFRYMRFGCASDSPWWRRKVASHRRDGQRVAFGAPGIAGRGGRRSPFIDLTRRTCPRHCRRTRSPGSRSQAERVLR
jgi:hypothetical protein